MNNIKFYSVLFFSALFLIITGALFNHTEIERYAIQSTQTRFGSMRISREREEKIKIIAAQMNVAQPLIIRKMNNAAMRIFGYCNAFVYFPKLFDIIPLSITPFLFVSEEFLEDLSPEEQRFLIGHEMVHVKECHTLYLNIIMTFLFLFLVGIYWLFIRIHVRKIAEMDRPGFGRAYNHRSKAKAKLVNDLFFIFVLPFVIVYPIKMAYMRHIEWQADARSLKILESYDGCCKLMDRWEKEFNIPQHNPYGGWFSDHPSCFERKQYCLTLKNESKEQNELSKV